MITVEKVKQEKAKEIQKAVNPSPESKKETKKKEEKSFLQKYKVPLIVAGLVGCGIIAVKFFKKKPSDDFSSFN